MPSSPPSERQPIASPAPVQPANTAATSSPVKLRHIFIALSAATLCLSFFLPWIKFLGAGLSGLDIQKHLESYRLVWLMPVLAAIVLVLSLARQNTSWIRRVAGFCPYVILVYALSHLDSSLLEIIQVGGWLALAAGAALIFITDERKPAP